MKCAICKFADREVVWQPFGPDESPLSFSRPGSHYRGFPIISICGFCQREKIEAGEEVKFKHKGLDYVFGEGMPVPIADVRVKDAAPDLFVALYEALDLFAHEFCYGDGRVIDAHGLSAGGAWVKQARAAIAKAKGE